MSASTHLSVPTAEQGLVYQCPVDAPVEVLGGKWKLVLLFYLLQAPRRNGELRRLVPSITQKMLTQQLRELERDGVVVRTVHDVVPPKVVYAINEPERERLAAVLDALCEWGLYWCAKTGARVLALETPVNDANQ
jgi:DNA-binding HxlR family transcriptional regulator